jgi:hypothetical protein
MATTKVASKEAKKVLLASADSPSLWNNTIAPGKYPLPFFL